MTPGLATERTRRAPCPGTGRYASGPSASAGLAAAAGLHCGRAAPSLVGTSSIRAHRPSMWRIMPQSVLRITGLGET